VAGRRCDVGFCANSQGTKKSSLKFSLPRISRLPQSEPPTRLDVPMPVTEDAICGCAINAVWRAEYHK
jgi:hypothetical protein